MSNTVVVVQERRGEGVDELVLSSVVVVCVFVYELFCCDEFELKLLGGSRERDEREKAWQGQRHLTRLDEPNRGRAIN